MPPWGPGPSSAERPGGGGARPALPPPWGPGTGGGVVGEDRLDGDIDCGGDISKYFTRPQKII